MNSPPAVRAPRQTIDGETITHFVELPYRRTGRRSWSVCGEQVDPRDQSDQPTCPACVAHLEQSADALFGTEADARAIGQPVHSTLSTPLSGYRPKGVRR